MDEILSSNENLLLSSSDAEHPFLHVGLTEPREERKIGLFTSGSTGDAKCIWNTLERLQLNAQITARQFGVAQGDRLLMMAKPWHVAGVSWMLMAEWLNLEYRFVVTRKGNEQSWLEAIRSFEPDCLLTVPPVLRSLPDAEWKVPKIVYGGNPVQKEDISRFAKHGNVLIQGYGQTEAGGLISCYTVETGEHGTGNVHKCYGRWPKEFAIRCPGSPRHPAPLWLESPTACRSGFYDTGDYGYINNGRLFLLGRGDDGSR